MKRAVLLVLLLAACKKDHQVGGIGRYNVDKTTLKDADGACTPDTNGGTYCTLNAPLGVKGMHADIDLYFDGKDPTSKVTEIQMKVGACDPQDLATWVNSNFGAPAEEHGPKKMWKNDAVWVVGELPLADDQMECIVHVVPTREKARFDKLWP